MEQREPNPGMGPVFFGVVLIAFLLRLGLSTFTLPLFDELNWMRIVDRIQIGAGSMHLPLHGDQHPPGQVYWSAFGAATVGHNLLGYRLGSVILGTIAVAATGLLGRELFGMRAGILGAILLAVNEYHLDISHRCTEKSYLTFAVVCLLLTVRLAKFPTTARWISLGAAFGLGALTKQTLAIWTLPVAAFLGRRLGASALLRRGPILAAVLFLSLLGIDLFWNFFAAHPASDPSARGMSFQLERLGFGSWSWGPSALYIRPLYFHRVEGSISEYASITTIPGILLLSGALASCFVLKESGARFLQALGFGTFLFFCVASNPRGEFWWADLTLLPFLVLTAATWTRLCSGVPALLAIPVLLTALPAAKLLGEENNYHPLDWGSPPPLSVEQFSNSQKFLFLSFKERDFVSLTGIGDDLALPARARHVRNLIEYRKQTLEWSERTAPDRRRSGLPPLDASNAASERDWVERELLRSGER